MTTPSTHKKQQYLLMFRRCKHEDTLDKIIAAKSPDLPVDAILPFTLAADHRRAEIKMNTLYDEIPPSVWKLI